MKKHLNEYTVEEKTQAVDLYRQGYSIRDICDLLDLSYYETVYLLNRKVYEFDPLEHLSFADVSDEELLIVSDTHIGSRKENFEYINEAYRIAQNRGINTAIHTGDLLQSTYAPIKPQYVDQEKQIEHVLRDYPEIPDFNTFMLLGNHDINTLKKDPLYMHMLKERKDFIIMGFKRAYLTWLGNLICLYHNCKRYRLNIPRVDTILELHGHSHKLSQDKLGYLYVPTLSDDMIQQVDAKPGFLISSIKDDTLTVESYRFENGLHEDGPVLTKKLK